MGMTYDQFWYGEPHIVKFYREAQNIRNRKRNQEMWWEGIYMADALNATVGNMFSKGSKHQYPAEPYPITEAEQQERKEREQKARMEKIKAAFTARALSMNAKMGGKTDDRE